MSLPAHERRALSAIDDGLRAGDPRLATMFAVFTELNEPEAMPPAEMVPASGWRARAVRRAGGRRASGPQAAGRLSAVVIFPLLLAATLSVLIMSFVTAGSGRQGQCAPASPVVATSHWRGMASCRPGPEQAATTTTR